ncbi:MAG: LysR family transcriptional regulator [Phenylobacterium sp.]|uniref:LysR family transcriptional regulator n=1 Tax=Phenylobacterium sp. TaxID=1871053 RepID=UPI0011F88B9D|nr:LysR family transcriptional regulator [Phenylobacterium sp.]TAJ68571.1 MAG: LysR family transcriptional regulator [Phenylobacterium sp.]
MSDIDQNKLRRLDGGLLLVFRELLRSGRASVAAERLGLSQPAISHALGRLRDLFEDPLFVRRPHGFEPTRRAIELGPRIEALIALAGDALTPDSRFDPASSKRMFRLSAPEFVTALIGGQLVNRLKAVAPGVTFVVVHHTEDQALRALKIGEADFAVGRFGAARPGYVVEPLFEDAYCAVARVGHPKIDGAMDWETWRDTGHIYARSTSETGGDVTKDEGDGLAAMLAAVPQWLTALVLVASTDGIATVPRRLAERHAKMLGLQVIDPPFEPFRIQVSVMRRTGVSDAGVDWFLDEVRAAATV